MGKKKLEDDIVIRIRRLRTKGYSLPEISKLVNVPKTTAFRYIKGIEILPEFIPSWSIKWGGSRKRKLLKEKQALKDAQKVVGNLSYKEKLLFLSALYWGEGSKKDFGLSNTDPELIRVFIDGLRNVFNISEERLRISIRIYEDLNKEQCLDFWSQVVGVPKEKFINIDVLSGKKKGKLRYGMCRIRVIKGGDLLKQIKGINKVITMSLA